MNYRLKVIGGKVKYLNRYNGEVVGSDTPLDSATWLLSRNEPEKSDEFKGFPIKVSANNSEYFLAGEWLNEKSEQGKAPRKRRIKDVVCE